MFSIGSIVLFRFVGILWATRVIRINIRLEAVYIFFLKPIFPNPFPAVPNRRHLHGWGCESRLWSTIFYLYLFCLTTERLQRHWGILHSNGLNVLRYTLSALFECSKIYCKFLQNVFYRNI